MKSSDNTLNHRSTQWANAGLLAAFTASLCCIAPVLALISGLSGLAATFSWTEPLRPYLIGITTVLLVFAWYQKIKPGKSEEANCNCEDDERTPFIHSKKFLGIITVLTIALLAFPGYSKIFYSNNIRSNSPILMEHGTPVIEKVELIVEGMTCTGCEAQIEHEVGMLPGIKRVEASYEKGLTIIEFASASVNLEQIKSAIDKTGYKVMDEKKHEQRASAKDTEYISFYKVPLVCNAATSIGCGSRAKPILLDLEKEEIVKESWLNRRGKVIAAVWDPDAHQSKKNEVIDRIFNKHGIKGITLVFNDYVENFESFTKRGGWYQGEEVNDLSKEEAAIITDRLIKAIKSETDLNSDQEKQLRGKIEGDFYDFFLNFNSTEELSDPEIYKKMLSEIKKYGDSILGKQKMPEVNELWSICTNDPENGGSKGASCCKSKKL